MDGFVKSTSEKINVESTMLMLNDDCILTIFSFLSLHGLVAMEQVCMRFQSLVRKIYSNMSSILLNDMWDRVERPLTVKEVLHLSEILPFSRIHTLKLTGDAFTDPTLSLHVFLRECGNVKELELINFEIYVVELELLRTMFINLKSANITNCDLQDSQVEMWLEEAKQLETLSLFNNWELQGDCLAALENIQEINLSLCRRLRLSKFIPFLNRNQGLKILNTDHLFHVQSWHALANLQNLESLTFVIEEFYNDYVDWSGLNSIADLPCLKHLNFKISLKFNATLLLQKLAQRDTLESLEISCYAGEDEEQDVIIPITFTKLKKLHIDGCCNLGGNILDWLSSIRTLQDLDINFYTTITHDGILKVIEKCRFLTVFLIYLRFSVTDDLIEDILKLLDGRNKRLDITVYHELPRESHSVIRSPKLEMRYNKLFDFE